MVVILLVWYVLPREWVAVFLGQSKIYNVDVRLGWRARRHDKVGGLDVPVNETARVDVFYAVQLAEA